MKNKKTNRKQLNRKLKSKILKMAEIDQRVRKSKKFDLEKMKEIDRKNTKEMKEIIKEHGWPGISLVGKRASAKAWLLIQHADLDLAFQKKSLNLIKKAVKRKDASKWEIAYLTDRILMNQKKKQIYGTQIRFDKETGEVTSYPIKNPKRINKLRKSFGLEPLEKYLNKVEKINIKLYGKSKKRTTPEKR